MADFKFKNEKTWITEIGLVAACNFVNDSHHCGYVGVPPDHPLHGLGYSQHSDALIQPEYDEPVGKRGIIPLMCAESDDSGHLLHVTPDIVFDVHGGITFAGDGDGGYPISEENDLWWFGFDCAHAGDATKFMNHDGDVFRTQEYVEQECESLARQLIERVNFDS